MVDAADVLRDPRGDARAALRRARASTSTRRCWRGPPGPRDTDGVWAPHWYAGVEASTGFAPYSPGAGDPLPDRLVPLLERCRPYYDALAPYRLRTEELPMKQQYDERNRDLVVGINDTLVHRDQAGISPFDSVVQGGDAVWEGLRLHGGRIFKLTEHLARLRRSAQALAFTTVPCDEEIVQRIRDVLAANAMTDDVHIRLTLTRGVKITSGMDPRLNQSGPTLIVLAEFKSPVYDDSGISLVTSSVRRHRPDSLDPKIHHNNLLTSILAKVEANVAGADDALMLDDNGFVAETNATHVFFVKDDVVRTSTTRACPEGITRETILEICTAGGHRGRGRRLLADPGLRRRRGLRDGHHGRRDAGAHRRRPPDRRRPAGAVRRQARRGVRRAHRRRGDPGRLRPLAPWDGRTPGDPCGSPGV